MKIMRMMAGAAALAGFVAASAPASAAVLFDSLGPASAGAGHTGVGKILGASFSTGGSSVILGDVSVLVQDDVPSDGGTFQISLLSDASTSPGAILAASASLPDSDLSTSFTLQTVDFGFSLAAHTRYWIELSSTSTTGIGWSYTNDFSGPGVSGEFWDDDGVFPNSEGPYQMEVKTTSTTTVPEPSTWAMLLIGFTGLGFAAYGRSRKRRLAAF
jgi:hypothetical protein